MRDTRNIILFSLSRLISEIGTSVFRFALSLYILDLTGSATMFALILSFTFIPGVLVNIFAGVFVDRADKKKVLIYSDLLSGISIFLFMILYHFQPTEIWLFAAYAIVLSTFQAFFTLAVNASVPNLVSEEKVAAVNSSNQSIGALISIIGPVMGAVAYSMLGLGMIFLLDAISFILSGFLNMLLLFRKSEIDPDEPQKSYMESMKEVYRYIQDRAAIKYILGIFVASNFVITPAVSLVLPYIVYNQLKLSAYHLSYIEAALAVGIIVGALIVAVHKVNRFVINKIFILIQLQALMIVLWVFPKFSFLPDGAVWLTLGYMGLLALTGIFNAMGNIPMISFVQLQIPERIRASIFGVVGTVTTLAVPIGMWVYGAMLDIFDYSYILVASGLSLIVLGALAHRNRDLREFFRQTPPAEPAPAGGQVESKTVEVN
ncbi:MFS transporter [Marinicrinis sediminis]|uniref:MFS transporter n=1 Tax=Marinicrinis sediminis TaxID=1652465 RepID=A0ABW5RBN6_9BACL